VQEQGKGPRRLQPIKVPQGCEAVGFQRGKGSDEMKHTICNLPAILWRSMVSTLRKMREKHKHFLNIKEKIAHFNKIKLVLK